MNRRRYLRTAGTVGSLVALAGCGQFLDNDSGEFDVGRSAKCGPYEPTVTGSTDWRTAGGDPAGTGVVPATEAPEPPLSLDWTVTLGGNGGGARPVATADRVYTHQGDSTLYAIDATSGEEVWTKWVDGPRGSLAVGDDTIVAVTENTVLGLDPETGETLWTGPESHVDLLHGSPVIADETAYVPAGLSLLALDLADGTVRWRHTTGEETVETPAIVGDTVYYGDSDTYVYALDAVTGKERWRHKTDAYVEGNVTVANGTVLAGSDDGVLHALEAATGDRRFTYDLEYGPNVIASDGAHAYVGSGSTLHAIEIATGTRCWSRSYRSSYSPGIAVGDGKMYAPLRKDRFEDEGLPGVLDAASGEELALAQGQFEASYARFLQGPAVVDGAVYATGFEKGGVALARFS